MLRLPALKVFGLSYPDDVEVVNLNQGEIISAFASGTGAMAGLWAPNIYTLEARAGAELLCSGQDAGAIVPGALISRRDYAEENPEMVARYLAVYLRGVEYIRANNDEAVSMMADFYALTGVELDDEYLQREIDTRPMFTLDEQIDLMSGDAPRCCHLVQRPWRLYDVYRNSGIRAGCGYVHRPAIHAACG